MGPCAKDESLAPYLKQLNDIDMQVAELEGVVAALDRHTSSLEGGVVGSIDPSVRFVGPFNWSVCWSTRPFVFLHTKR